MTWSFDKASLSGSSHISIGLPFLEMVRRYLYPNLRIRAECYQNAYPLRGKQTGTGILGLARVFVARVWYAFVWCALAIQRTYRAVHMLSGAAVIPCLLSDNQPVTGRFRLPVDRISSDNLLLTLTSVRKYPGRAYQHAPAQLTTSTLLLDLFGGGGDFPAVSTSSSCFIIKLSHPLWRGIIIPTAQVQLKMPSRSFTFLSRKFTLRTNFEWIKTECEGHDGKNKILKYGAFSILLDSLSTRPLPKYLCNN